MINKEGKKLADWLSKQIEEYQLTAEAAASRLGLSLASFKQLISGRKVWATLQPDIKSKLEEVFGPYPDSEDSRVSGNVEFREGSGTAFLRDIEQEIEELLGVKPEQAQQDLSSNVHRGNIVDDRGYSVGGYIDGPCYKCGSLLREKDNGKCPNCKTVQDGSH